MLLTCTLSSYPKHPPYFEPLPNSLVYAFVCVSLYFSASSLMFAPLIDSSRKFLGIITGSGKFLYFCFSQFTTYWAINACSNNAGTHLSPLLKYTTTQDLSPMSSIRISLIRIGLLNFVSPSLPCVAVSLSCKQFQVWPRIH